KALPIRSPSRLDLARHVQFAHSGDFWANHQLGYDLRELGKHAEAVRYYTAALALRPDNPGVLLNRANALHRAGELEAAAGDLQRAVAVAPGYAGAYVNLGIVLGEQKKLEEAITAFRKAEEAFEKYGAQGNIGHQARHLGFMLEDLKRYAGAEEAFQKAVKVFEELSAKAPNEPWNQHFVADSYRRIAKVLVADKRVRDGEQYYRMAIETHEKREARFPGFLHASPFNHAEWVTCYVDLASLLASSDRGKEAKALYKRAL